MKTITTALTAIILAAPAIADVPPAPPETPVEVSYEQACEPVSLTIYFGDEAGEITPQALATINAATDQVEGCAVTEIKATAMAADADTGRELLAMSEARADAVLEAFASAGLWAKDVRTDIVLASDSAQPERAVMPLARRVEVQLTTVKPISS